MKNFIADGQTYPFTCTAAVSSGDVIVMNDTLGIAKSDGAIGEMIATQAKGVSQLPKLTATVIDQGKKVYWDATAKVINLTASGNVYAGRAYEASGNGPTTVNVDLNA